MFLFVGLSPHENPLNPPSQMASGDLHVTVAPPEARVALNPLSSAQNPGWLMIIWNYTTPNTGDYNNPIVSHTRTCFLNDSECP